MTIINLWTIAPFRPFYRGGEDKMKRNQIPIGLLKFIRSMGQGIRRKNVWVQGAVSGALTLLLLLPAITDYARQPAMSLFIICVYIVLNIVIGLLTSDEYWGR